MRIYFSSVSPRQRILAGTVLAASAAGSTILALLPSWEFYLLTRPTSCLLKLFAGIPCLACRGTRAALALSHGQAGLALRYNPLATIFLTSLATYLALLTLSGKAPQAHLSRPESLLFWTALAFALLGNWIYVIVQGG